MKKVQKLIFIITAISLISTCFYMIVGGFFLDGFEMFDFASKIFGVNVGLGFLYLLSVLIPIGYEMEFKKDTEEN